MTLNPAQFEEFVCNYVQHIVDGLDTESLECMLSDLLFTVYETYTEEQILGEVTEIYGEEVASDLLESVDPHMPVA
jgi:flagellar motor component MotA